MKKGYGICPATCGELVQGYIGNREFISSYCIDLYSSAVITEKKNSYNRINKKQKSLKAVSYVFDYFGVDKSQLKDIQLRIRSNISIGKGMASSTADIGASIMAALDYLDKDMSADEISMMVSRIEPTDAIYHPEICIFDPLKGLKKESLGFLDQKKVLVLEPDERINTVKIRKSMNYYRIFKENKTITENSFNLLKKGIKESNIEDIRIACENSALVNENIKETPYLRQLIYIARACDYGFLNISHTGTVVGISISSNTDLEKMIYEIKNSRLSDVYKKVYVKNIVKGGLRKGKEHGIYKKSK